jgi:peroxiredoxin
MEAEQQLQRLGIEEVLVYCVNDGAVMKGWQDSFKLEDDDFVKLFGDPAGTFTAQLGLEMDKHPGPIGVGIIGRSKRFAIYVDDGVVKAINVAAGPNDPAGDDAPETTLAPAMIEAIKSAQK